MKLIRELKVVIFLKKITAVTVIIKHNINYVKSILVEVSQKK